MTNRVKLNTTRLFEVFTYTVNLPIELHVTPSEYFLLVDSGANIHVLWDRILAAHHTEQNSVIGWSGPQTSPCVAIGWVAIVTYCKIKSGTGDKIILTSGTKDTWIVLDAKRPIFSQVRAKHQGHTCILDGDTPGLIIKGTNLHIPFVECPESGFCLLTAYPPSSCAIHNTIYSSSMNVINLNQSTSIHNTVALCATKSTRKSKKVADKKINIAAKLRT